MWDESARAAFTELLPPGHEFPEPDAERWYSLIEDPGVSMLLAEEDGELLGFSTSGESRDDDADPPWARSAASSWPPAAGARAWDAR